jgi:Tfp pilus assembly protein PilZ
MSALGLYIAVEPHPPVGQTVSVGFPLPGGVVAVEAIVTWQNDHAPERVDGLPPGCGLRFTSLLPHDREQIESLVADFKERAKPQVVAKLGFLDVVQVPCYQVCYVVRADGTILRGRLCYVSLHGVFVAVEPIPEMGEEVQVSFTLLADPTPIVDRTVVTWQSFGPPQKVDSFPSGCGLRFLSLEDDDRSRIEAVVKEYVALATGRESGTP